VLLTQLRGNGIDAIHESKKDDAMLLLLIHVVLSIMPNRSLLTPILRYVDAKEEGMLKKYMSPAVFARYKDDLEKEIRR